MPTKQEEKKNIADNKTAEIAAIKITLAIVIIHSELGKENNKKKEKCDEEYRVTQGENGLK